MTPSDALLAELRAAVHAAADAYAAAVKDDATPIADILRLARKWSEADARLDGATLMMRALIAESAS